MGRTLVGPGDNAIAGCLPLLLSQPAPAHCNLLPEIKESLMDADEDMVLHNIYDCRLQNIVNIVQECRDCTN